MFDVVLFGFIAINILVFVLKKLGFKINLFNNVMSFSSDIDSFNSRENNSSITRDAFTHNPSDPWENRHDASYSSIASNMFYNHDR